ncbi:flagellar protein FlgN [Massilibacterium senegalense]|uniref:flagellar protein FlgN n=1 Tax=Massilibacterium senegalense TaxID=1632858 RepID=UPI000780BDA7|nr:flagellar protein FlgN [Massilibacterium senegalense]
MEATAIVQLLDTFIQTHQELNQLAKEKEQAVIHSDLEQIKTIIQKETMYVKMLEQLERQREQIAKQVIQTGDRSLKAMLPFFHEQDQVTMIERQQTLMAEIETLQYQNALNQQLIFDSLKFINLSLDLAQPVDPFARYSDRTDEEDGRPVRSMFDTKA